jgi:hypothetical protein
MTHDKRHGPVISSVSPVIGAGLTIAGWVVVGNVAWQLECLPAWSQMGEIGRRSTDTLLALVAHSPAESAAAAMGGVAGGVLINRRRGQEPDGQPLGGPIGIVPSAHDRDGSSDDDDPEPA